MQMENQDEIVSKMITLPELAEKYQYFIFDCDGVLWHGNNHIGKSFRNVEWL